MFANFLGPLKRNRSVKLHFTCEYISLSKLYFAASILALCFLEPVRHWNVRHWNVIVASSILLLRLSCFDKMILGMILETLFTKAQR